MVRGRHPYRALGRIDAWHGVGSWAEGLDWIASHPRIDEIQFWGHGKWGGVWIDEELLDATALEPNHYLYDRLGSIRDRLAPNALWWFRSCDVFGTEAGQDFARRWTRFFGCSAAGHTHTIRIVQSGLHLLRVGEEPSWPLDEGVVRGLSHADTSRLRAPRTITFLHNRIPA